ncbi:MAG: glycosyltransferase [Candidatus Hydrogenedentes bacterium]|nr:glycosyltransferase [Candidatus Hydrogenedentota bacterium]
MATITVAVCARNAQDIIGACLESIRRQTVAPDEVVVALDDLGDPTGEVAKAYGARVIASNATGLYEARNAVLASCTTDYLAFTDADCVLVPEWVAHAKRVLDEKPDVAAGTGRHPPVGPRNFAAWLHHMWFIVETERTGYTRGIIGGNSYFRMSALREVGGWLNLPRHSAAEDVYIAMALQQAGHRIWFEEGAAVEHHYETRFRGLMRKSQMMGKDITVMMRACGFRGGMWWYTLAIPLLAAMLPFGLLLAFFNGRIGAGTALFPLIVTLLFLINRFRSVWMAVPRWIARWIVIWPYAYGILKGLFAPIPDTARRPLRDIGRVPERGRIFLTCSHGGHLSEMLQLADAFNGHELSYFCYDADTTRALPNARLVPNAPYNPIEFVKNLARVWKFLSARRPDLVVSTGAEIAIPVFLVAKLRGIPCAYIECGAQFTTPSLTGRVLCRLADRFYVQWPELLAAYGGQATYAGSLIDETAPDSAQQ